MRIVAYAIVIATLFVSLTAQAAKETYRGALRHATHRGQTYDANTWDAKVIWYATFFDGNFRRAFAKQHAKIHYMGPAEAAQWTADQEYEQSRAWEFFVSIYTKRDYKKFSLDSDTFWETFLTTGSGDVVWPDSIEQVSVTPYEKVMYRHINRWSKCYIVKFPKVDIGAPVYLTLRSIVGQSSLLWFNPQ